MNFTGRVPLAKASAWTYGFARYDATNGGVTGRHMAQSGDKGGAAPGGVRLTP